MKIEIIIKQKSKEVRCNMAIDCLIYNPVTGDLISDERFFSIPFLYGSNQKYGKCCVVNQDQYLHHIDKWTLDKNDELWHSVMDMNPLMQDGTDICTFYTKDEIIKMDGYESIKDSLIEIMENNNINGFIVQLW